MSSLGLHGLPLVTASTEGALKKGFRYTSNKIWDLKKIQEWGGCSL